MGPRYSFDSDPGEHVPLDHSSSYARHDNGTRPPPSQRHSIQDHPAYHIDAPQPRYQDDLSSPPYRDHPSSSSRPPPAIHPAHPGAHPDSVFARLRQNRAQGGNIRGGPIPPPHREPVERSWRQEAHLSSSITPGADNFSEAAAGGIPGLAMSVAERHARESGVEAMRTEQPYQQQPPYPQIYEQAPPENPPYTDTHQNGRDQGYSAQPYQEGHGSSPSLVPVASGSTPSRSLNSFQSDPFRDPQLAYGQRMDPMLGQVDPNSIDDDGDDGLEYRRSARNSMLSLGNSSGRGGNGNSAVAAAGAAGATGVAAATAASGGVLSGLIGRNRNDAANYDPVQNPAAAAYQGAGADEYNLGPRAEKSEWMAKQSSSRKKWTWIIAIVVILIVAGAVVGGVLGSMYANKGKKASGSASGDGGGGGGGQSAGDDTAQNGDLGINSDEIQALLNNPNLHKVFPGVDYTPINVQYPDCLKNPPSQNNVTRDMAILSQLTNTVRLYGTDCNQTEMAIHAIRQLKMENEIKIWLGVWQDENNVTNTRQLDRMWTILDQYGSEPFKGLIVGNEILFRQQMTAQMLGTLLDDVRANLSRHNWDLPVATSDLGDNWDANLAELSDYIMGNVHPFFAGQDAKQAAAWTWTFWQNKAGSFFKSDPEKNVISEIGWPTKGGTNCGGALTCEDGAVAGIDELNTLLDTWVCQALNNGTNYFWFEMFDEPWKISFNEPGKEWEDQWGILDVNRNLKDGVKIPDCGGKTV
ncbi:putative endo-beta- -glucanase [Rosellinia necatrix]|uniref:glucan endo-1,3-beta-D-glucosidase n=1 Tax=Rosellinia necatrix TaxID=77044 RepID=A0A1W2TF65_ROSNE|nr:putative endo-beta- -glucanase [Rosellinia necatrix]